MMLRFTIVFFVVFTLLACTQVLAQEGLSTDSRSKLLRDKQTLNEGDTRKMCTSTAIRLRLDLNRIYGEWFPADASESAYRLWLTSLYGFNSSSALTSIVSPTMTLSPGPESRTLNILISHKDKKVEAQAALLGDARHPAASKWVISWPNGEDTLTSVVACGSTSKTEGWDLPYDWMITVDCDLNGVVSSDWTIFARKGGLPWKTMDAIKAIVDGIIEKKNKI